MGALFCNKLVFASARDTVEGPQKSFYDNQLTNLCSEVKPDGKLEELKRFWKTELTQSSVESIPVLLKKMVLQCILPEIIF
jgi:hypothetical protein